MNERREQQSTGITVRADEPLIAVPVTDNQVRYFASREELDATIGQDAVQQGLDLAGAWAI